MSLSTQTVVSDGTLVQLSLSIDFVTRSSIHVYFDNSEQTLGTTWAWVGTTGNTIAFSPAVTNAVVVIVRRSTDLSAPTHVFNAGAQFNEASLDANFTQVLHSAQESSDGATVKESFVNFDLHGNRITSLGNGTAASDAVNKGQLDALGVATTASAAASAASASDALASAIAAAVSAGVSSTKAAESAASAVNSSVSAGNASASAAAAVVSADAAAAIVATIVPATIVRKTSDTGAVINPVGTTGQRPTPVYGYSRINSTLNIPEWWNGTAWVPMGGQFDGGRNKVLNGNFDVWQLGNSINISGHLQKCADRWNYDYNGTIGTLNISKVAVGPGTLASLGTFAPKALARLTMSVAPSGNTFQDFSTTIESVFTLHNRQVTISFYAVSLSGGNQIIVKTEQYFGGGGSSPVFNTSSPITISNTAWSRYSVTFNLDSVASKTLGVNGDDTLNVILSLPINQTFDFLIAGVQIEEGAVATPFDTPPYADTFAMCQRYLQTSYTDGTNPGTPTGSGSVAFYASVATDLFTIQLKAPMRHPTQAVTFYNPATGAAGTWNNAGSAISVGLNTNGSKNLTAALSGATPASYVSGHYVIQDPYI